MKLLFLADVPLKNPTSGSEQVLNRQATGLAREGMEVCAITRRAIAGLEGTAPTVWQTVEGVKEACYSAHIGNPARFCESVLKHPPRLFEQFILHGPFDATVSHQPFTCASLLMNKRFRRIPMIYVFHSPSHEEYLLANGGRVSWRLLPNAYIRRTIEGICVRRSQRIVVLSQFMKHKAQTIHRVSPEKVVVNPGGVDVSVFVPPRNRSDLKRRLGLPPGKVHLLTVRNLEPRMGLDNLLMAINMLKKTRADVHLTLGGDGDERQTITQLIEELGLADVVSMTGFIEPGLLHHYYGAADFFVLPTRHLEGFGLVTTESLACGTPVLGTPVGGTKEILSKFDPGFLFGDTSPKAMADGIQTAIDHFHRHSDNGSYEALRRRCRAYATTNYSWKRHSGLLMSTLEALHGPNGVLRANRSILDGCG
jgi:glycosyltransferase involved in cell wall biosynthesis